MNNQFEAMEARLKEHEGNGRLQDPDATEIYYPPSIRWHELIEEPDVFQWMRVKEQEELDEEGDVASLDRKRVRKEIKGVMFSAKITRRQQEDLVEEDAQSWREALRENRE